MIALDKSKADMRRISNQIHQLEYTFHTFGINDKPENSQLLISCKIADSHAEGYDNLSNGSR